jgi:hypothetical protein
MKAADEWQGPVLPAAGEAQFKRFLTATDQLAESLNGIFDECFVKMLHSSERKPASAGPLEALTVVDAAEKITRLADQRKKRVPQDFPSFPADKLPSAVVARLHFAEAMMVLLFNALDEKQRESAKQGFARMLDSVDTSEIPGGRQETMRAYKDALAAMHSSMLSSNLPPEEMAAALSVDFAKKFA